jgi:excisionase family DNA binding protein
MSGPYRTTERYALTIKQACEFTSLSRSTIYNLNSAGKLKIRKVGGRSLIFREDLLNLLGAA